MEIANLVKRTIEVVESTPGQYLLVIYKKPCSDQLMLTAVIHSTEVLERELMKAVTNMPGTNSKVLFAEIAIWANEEPRPLFERVMPLFSMVAVDTITHYSNEYPYSFGVCEAKLDICLTGENSIENLIKKEVFCLMIDAVRTIMNTPGQYMVVIYEVINYPDRWLNMTALIYTKEQP